MTYQDSNASLGSIPSDSDATVTTALPGDSDRTLRLRAELDVAEADGTNWRLVSVLTFFLKLSISNGCVAKYREGANLSVIAHLADIGTDGIHEVGGVIRETVLRWASEFPLSEKDVSVRDGVVVDTGYIRERVRLLARKKKAAGENFHCNPRRPTHLSWWALAHELGVERDDLTDPKLRSIIEEEGPYEGPRPQWLGEEGLSRSEYLTRRDEVWPYVIAWKQSGRPLPCKPGCPSQTDWRRLERGLDGDAPEGKSLATSYQWKVIVRKLFGERPAPEGTVSARVLTWHDLAMKGEKLLLAEKAGQKTAEKSTARMVSLLGTLRISLGSEEHEPVASSLAGDADKLTLGEMGIVDRAKMSPDEKRRFENNRSLIRQWQRLAIKCAGAGELPATIEECIEYLCRLHDYSLAEVARGTGIPQDALVEMRRGKRKFNPTRIDDAHALQNFFGLEDDELVKRIHDHGRRRWTGAAIPEEFKDVDRRVWAFVDPTDPPDRIRKHVASVQANTLRQPRLASESRREGVEFWKQCGPDGTEIRNERVVAEFKEFREFRTALDVGGQNRGKPVATATADIDEQRMTAHLRWQALGREHGGAGVDPLSLTAASMFNPQNLITDVLWRTQRLQHVEYKGEKRGVVATVADQHALLGAAQLMRDPNGWMRQNAKVFAEVAPIRVQLPILTGVVDKNGKPLQRITDQTDLTVLSDDLVAIIRSGDVTALCRAVETRYRQFATTLEAIIDRTRDSWVPVMDILKEDRPMDHYWRCVLQGREFHADPATQPAWYFNDLRDQLIMEWYGSVFLRSRTMGLLEYRKDNSGNLRIDGNTVLLHIQPGLFKNRRRKSRFGPPGKPRPYERELVDLEGSHAMLFEYIDRLQHRRKRKGAAYDTDFLWPSTNGNPLIDSSMNEVVVQYTRRHFVHDEFAAVPRGIPGVMFFGPQAIRSLGATQKIKQHPGTFGRAEAADLLYTSIEMIEDDYARIEVVLENTRFDEDLLASVAAGRGVPSV